MKQLTTVLNGVLLIAVIVLFVLHFSNGKSVKSDEDGADGLSVSGDHFAVAYINTDSLLLNYEYAKELNQKMVSKEEASRADFNEKAKVFQQDAVEFQRKVQNNAFLSMDRANQEQQRLAKAERDLQELNQRLSNELMMEQDKTNKMLRDTIITFLDVYVKDNPYKLILSNTLGDNVLYGAKGTDVTSDVVKQLNARFAISKN